MPQEKGETKPVFVPKPAYQAMYSNLDQALIDSKKDHIKPEDRAAAIALVLSLQAEIALLGDSAGEFVYL